MNKEQYKREMSQLRASEDVKRRICEAAKEQQREQKGGSPFSGKMLRVAAGFAVIAAMSVVGMGIVLQGGKKQEVINPAQTKPHETKQICELVKNEFNQNLATQFEMSVENDFEKKGEAFHLIIKIKNNSGYPATVSKDFWVCEEDPDPDKGFNFIDATPGEGYQLTEETIDVPDGQEISFDITEQFLAGYSRFLSQECTFMLGVNVEVQDEAKSKTFIEAMTSLTSGIVPNINNCYISQGKDMSVDVEFTQEKDAVQEVKASYKLFTRDVQTAELKERETLESSLHKGTDDTGNKVWTYKVQLPSMLEPGLYYIETSLKIGAKEMLQKRTLSFVVLEKQEITLDKNSFSLEEVMTSGLHLDMNMGKMEYGMTDEYQCYSVELFGVEAENHQKPILAYYENIEDTEGSVLGVDMVVNDGENLLPGEYLVVFSFSNKASEIQEGVGTYITEAKSFAARILLFNEGIKKISIQ